MTRSLMTAVLLAVAALPGFADDPPPPPATSPAKNPAYADFSLIVERNVFDTKRKSATVQGSVEAAAAAAAETAAPKELVILTGVVIENEDARALFEGSADASKDGLKPGDTIAGYRLGAIKTDGITLVDDKGTIHLPVGAGLTKTGDGAWKPIDNPMPGAAVGSGTTAVEKVTGGGKNSDAAEKLRKRRRKELGL